MRWPAETNRRGYLPFDQCGDMLVTPVHAAVDPKSRCGAKLCTAPRRPPSELMTLEAEIASADPDADSVVINGLLYEWEDCSQLTSELVGVEAAAVPAASGWSLAVLITLLATIGVIFAGRNIAR